MSAPFETPFDELATVGEQQPARNAVWWASFAIHSCAAISIVVAICAICMTGTAK